MIMHLLALLFLMSFVAPVAAQMVLPVPCGPTAEMEGYIARTYGEVPVGAGINPRGWPVMVLTNPETGTFTVLFRRPDGQTCLLAGGKGFAIMEPSPVKTGQGL